MAREPRTKNTRRVFLKQMPLAAAGLAVPARVGGGLGEQSALRTEQSALRTEQPALRTEQAALRTEQSALREATPQAITADTLAAAQQVAGVALPPAELDAVRPLVERNLANIEAIRRVTVPSELEPAFSFHPPRPRRAPREMTEAAPSPLSPRSPRPTRPPREMTPGPRPANLEGLAFESITSLGARLRAKQVTSTELTAMYLARLKRADPTLFCVVTFTDALALEQAAEADRLFALGRDLGPLHGIPYGIKDLFATKGIPTTWGAQPYANQVFDYDATAVVRMREAGAVLIAKLTTGELAVGDLWFKARTRNPWNPERGSSGSSAGPAAAASAGLVGFAIGTETGGSIISPASTCGVVGLRPTYGRSSRYGAMTLRWTLDKVGALARTVEDTAYVLDALHGPDGHDETVADLPFEWRPGAGVRGMRIGYLASEFAAASPANKPIYDAALEVYRQAGATLVPVAMPDLPASAMYAILNAEAGAMFDELVRSGGINDLADKGVNGRANQLRAARFIPAVDYIRAQRVRTLLVAQVSAMFAGPDPLQAFLSPSSSDSVAACNLTGHPAITIPCGFTGGLPVGLMVTGPLFEEGRILDVAGAFEAATDWHTRHPA